MEFLLEINTEELPSDHVEIALSQLGNKVKDKLEESNVLISGIKTYGTCRRLVVVGDLAAEQKDKKVEIIGPPKTKAFMADCSPSPAAKGFARSQGVSVDELDVIEIEKGEYIGIRKVIRGKPTQEILINILPQIISSVSFPKMMRWGESTFKFSRPVKNILCLFDGQVLSFSVGGVFSNDFTSGHRMYFPQKIQVRSFSEYKDILKKNKVILEQEKRKKLILAQIERKLTPLEAQLFRDEQLLEKLTYDIEHPYVFLGRFPEKYLKLPIEILSTAMKVGQNLFSVVKRKKQLPYFLGVADAFKDTKTLIRRGNERVLKARLEDARFFWEQDSKLTLMERTKQLNKIIFQEGLGSYEDKAWRLKKIASYLADKLEVNKEKKYIVQAAELCKVDILTEMVREFPSLQGKVGGLYARKEGYPALIWKAIYEHYQPLSLEDKSPSSLSGAILSIADKVDSIVGQLGIGISVSGSKDPFGLRRSTQGVCKIILDKKLNLPFSRLMDKVLNVLGDKLQEDRLDVKDYCLKFFKGRLQYIFERKGYRYDLVKAALAPGIDNIYYSYLRLRALDSLKDSSQFEPMILIAKRVNNILREQPQYKVNSELFFEKQERELYTTFTIIKENILPLISRGDFSKAQRIAFRIRSSINNFFDHVLVMDDDKRIRQNRLALLQAISKLLIQIADYSQVVIKG